MRSTVIVEVDEPSEAGHPLSGVSERTGIGPLGQQGPNEPFGLAVGLGPVGPRSAMTDPELVARLGEETTDVRAAVVGEDPLDCDAMGRIEVPRSAEEGSGRRGELIGQLFDVGQTAMV